MYFVISGCTCRVCVCVWCRVCFCFCNWRFNRDVTHISYALNTDVSLRSCVTNKQWFTSFHGLDVHALSVAKSVIQETVLRSVSRGLTVDNALLVILVFLFMWSSYSLMLFCKLIELSLFSWYNNCYYDKEMQCKLTMKISSHIIFELKILLWIYKYLEIQC